MTNQIPRRAHTFQPLDEAECMQLLHTRAVGRIAFDADDGIQVYPVNHVVYDGNVYFRVSPYSRIVKQLQHSSQVSYQVDDFDEFLRAGWSVLLLGTGELVDVHEAMQVLPSTDFPEP